MTLKRLFQILILLALLFSPFGANQQARASTNLNESGNIRNFSPFQDIVQVQPILSMDIHPSSVNIGETAIATASLNNVPPEGYTSAELTCTYDPSAGEVSNIVIGNLFGLDPVTAINGPHAGRFVVAIAGSADHKATSSGTVMAFVVRGLKSGQTDLKCRARVSQGNDELISIDSIPASLIVLGGPLTPTVPPAPCDKAEFVADMNVPPGTVMSPGETFIKIWRLANTGSCAWTNSYQLVFFSGEQMGAPSQVPFNVNVVPGQTVDVYITLTAPSVPGSYRGYWMLKNANGALFGSGPQGNEPWFVDITVPGSTVTSSPTFTPSPNLDTPTATPSPTGTISETPGGPTNSPTPTVTPGGPVETPVLGVVYDFAAGMCSATWTSAAGQLPCPGIDGNPNGFVFKVDNPKLETGATDTRTALLTFPQNIQNGYIQGMYPPFHVQSGDRFRSTLTCEFGATGCYVAFRIDYQVGAEPIKTLFGSFLERYEGRNYTADIDLSSLAGKDVKFILTVLSAGIATGDRAMWVGPIIYRTIAGSTPTLEQSTATPTESPLTSTPVEATMPTSTPSTATGTITGQVLAGKPVTVDLFTEDNWVVTSIAANADGTFSLTAPAGRYNIVAHASGFLSALGSATITGGSTSVKPMIILLAGDIDSNFMINQLDAMTIGMNYNKAAPTEADLNTDGIINVLDLELLAKNYRKTGPVSWE